MCGGYRLEADPESLAMAFGVEHVQLELPWSAELYPGSQAPVVLDRRDASQVRTRHLGALRWGLVPHWAKDPSIGHKMFNARVESIADKAAFRDAFARRRCLVPVQAFYEWRGAPGHKERLAFWSPDHQLLALAGLWEMWRDPEGRRLGTFTVVTTDANRWVSSVHPRMPLLVSPRHWDLWLAPGQDATKLLPVLVDEQAQIRLDSALLPR